MTCEDCHGRVELDAALDVRCPQCAMASGEACQQTNGEPRLHLSRWSEGRAALDAGLFRSRRGPCEHTTLGDLLAESIARPT